MYKYKYIAVSIYSPTSDLGFWVPPSELNSPRVQHTLNHILQSTPLILSEKPETKGCNEAARYRFDLSLTMGVDPKHELKTLLYEDETTVFVFFTSATFNVVPKAISGKTMVSENRLTALGLLPYTINPINVLSLLKDSPNWLENKTLTVIRNGDMEDLPFLTNNMGSRRFSTTMLTSLYLGIINELYTLLAEILQTSSSSSYLCSPNDFAPQKKDRQDGNETWIANRD